MASACATATAPAATTTTTIMTTTAAATTTTTATPPRLLLGLRFLLLLRAALLLCVLLLPAVLRRGTVCRQRRHVLWQMLGCTRCPEISPPADPENLHPELLNPAPETPKRGRRFENEKDSGRPCPRRAASKCGTQARKHPEAYMVVGRGSDLNLQVWSLSFPVVFGARV